MRPPATWAGRWRRRARRTCRCLPAARARCGALAASDPALAGPIPGAGHPSAEAVHACTHQGALDLDDILARRLRVVDRGARPRPGGRRGGRAGRRARAGLVGRAGGGGGGRYVRLRDAEAAAEAAPDDASARAAYQEMMRR